MITALDIAKLLDGKLVGEPNFKIEQVRPINSPIIGGLAIVCAKSDLAHIGTTQADVLIGPARISESNIPIKIIVDTLQVNKLNKLLRYYKVQKYQLFDQGNTSVIPDVYIGKGCKIGSDCLFMPGVKIMNGVTIGNNVVIHANTVIKEGTVIGSNVTIDSNNSIGNFSFEYMNGEDNQFERVESVGRVIIEDDVEIGNNNTIDRGTFGDTLIGKGTKIDNLIQIGHDCQIGKHCLLTSQSGFAGHTKLGNYVIVHGQAGTAGHVSIGDYSVIKAKSGVSHSYPKHSNLFGYPAKDSRAYYKNLAVLNQLTKQFKSPKQLDIPAPPLRRHWLKRLFNTTPN